MAHLSVRRPFWYPRRDTSYKRFVCGAWVSAQHEFQSDLRTPVSINENVMIDLLISDLFLLQPLATVIVHALLFKQVNSGAGMTVNNLYDENKQGWI